MEGHTQAVEGTLDALIERFVGYEAEYGISNDPRWRELASDAVYSAIEQIWQMAWRLGFYRGGPVFMSAISGIDIALWDLKGTSLPT